MPEKELGNVIEAKKPCLNPGCSKFVVKEKGKGWETFYRRKYCSKDCFKAHGRVGVKIFPRQSLGYFGQKFDKY